MGTGGSGELRCVVLPPGVGEGEAVQLVLQEAGKINSGVGVIAGA